MSDPSNDQGNYETYQQPPPRRVTVRPPAPTPWLTYVFIGLSVAIFLGQMFSQYVLGGDILAYWGDKNNKLIMAGQYWRLLTPILLHANILHIAFNMYALYIIGRGLEQYYGHLRYFMLYIVGGLAGNVLSFFLSPANALGASTSIFGLLVAEGIFVYQNRQLFGEQARAMLTNTLSLVAINLFLGFVSPGIDNWGHMGGLLGGLAFSWFAGPVLHARPAVGGYVIESERSMGRAWLVAIVEVVILVGLVYQRIALR